MTKPLLNLLEHFKREACSAFPGFVKDVLLFGSQARGDADDSSDIDVLVVTETDDWRMGDEIRRIGHELDLTTGARLSILVMPQSHVEELVGGHYQFMENMQRDCVRI